jgi:hypothetical protein
VLNADALAGKNTLNPEVLDNVRAGLAAAPGRAFKLVANLPYNVATPIVGNLLVHPELRPARMVVTIQKELADRMLAPPAAEAYGALSVTCQALADVTLVRTLPPSVFWPRPKVDSAVVMLVPDPAKRAAVGDVDWFHSVVRRVFLHRRKNLRSVLSSLYRDRWTNPRRGDGRRGVHLPGRRAEGPARRGILSRRRGFGSPRRAARVRMPRASRRCRAREGRAWAEVSEAAGSGRGGSRRSSGCRRWSWCRAWRRSG